MGNEITEKLQQAAMLESADGVSDSFKKMIVNIDRVLRSEFVSGVESKWEASPMEKPVVLTVSEESLRDDEAAKEKIGGADMSKLYEEPYVVVPRVVGA